MAAPVTGHLLMGVLVFPTCAGRCQWPHRLFPAPDSGATGVFWAGSTRLSQSLCLCTGADTVPAASRNRCFAVVGLGVLASWDPFWPPPAPPRSPGTPAQSRAP